MTGGCETSASPSWLRHVISPRVLTFMPARQRLRVFWAHLGLLALIALLVPVNGSWAAQLLLVLLLLTVPGVILLRALRIPGDAIAAFPVYLPCASLLVLLVSGLAVDLIAPLAGVVSPLRPVPLLAGLEAICLVLLASCRGASPDLSIPWGRLSQRTSRYALPLGIPLAAAAGALRLNSGYGHGVALTALWACVITVVAVLAFAPRCQNGTLAVVLYATGLALLWSFSLRGDSVYGFDIAQEYHLFQNTVLQGRWFTPHPGDAYGAMLSVTVLPAELHELSGLAGLLVFKVIYPMIAALLPVAVFGLANRVLTRRWAFLAGALILTQANFAQELPALARQEVALMFFAAMAGAMLDTRIPRLRQWAVVILFAFGMVVSHYSTTYATIVLLGLTLALQFMMSWIGRVPRVCGAVALAFFSTLAGAAVWYGPITHSSSNLTQFVEIAGVQGFDLLPNRVQGEGLLGAYLQGNTQTPIPAAQYAELVHSEYAKSRTYITPFPDAGLARYTLRDSSPPSPPLRWAAAGQLLGDGQLVAQQSLYVLGAVGALLILIRRDSAIAPNQTVLKQLALLALGTLILLVVTRLSGTVATQYNAERAFIQAVIFMSVAVSWNLQEFAGAREWRSIGALGSALALVAVILANSSGLVSASLGGATAVNLANSGEDAERYLVTTPEVASAEWLQAAVRPGELVYSDLYGQLRLAALPGRSLNVITDITPLTLNQSAWVYASRTDVIDGRARAVYGDHSVSYVFPQAFLEAHYDLVYADGSTEVFHR
jgi:uncharacterized membrane protein